MLEIDPVIAGNVRARNCSRQLAVHRRCCMKLGGPSNGNNSTTPREPEVIKEQLTSRKIMDCERNEISSVIAFTIAFLASIEILS